MAAAFPYMSLDATYVNVRDDALGRVVSRAVVIATDNIDLVDRCAVIVGKGGSAERIFWSSITARRLPRLINGRPPVH